MTKSYSVRDYCTEMETAIAHLTRNGEYSFGVDDTVLSDHRYKLVKGKMFTLMTWNVCNEAWMNLITDAGDDGQHLNKNWFAQPANAAERLEKIVGVIAGFCGLAPTHIVCLQEVSDKLLSMLEAVLRGHAFMVSPDGFGDRNVVIFNPSEFIILRSTPMILNRGVENAEQYLGNAYVMRKPTLPANLDCICHNFTLMNVHIPFGKNKEFAKMLGDDGCLSWPYPTTIVVGDFNADCRLPRESLLRGDHLLDHYSGLPNVVFFQDNFNAWPVCHVTCRNNVNSEQRMFTAVDHFMGINCGHLFF